MLQQLEWLRHLAIIVAAVLLLASLPVAAQPSEPSAPAHEPPASPAKAASDDPRAAESAELKSLYDEAHIAFLAGRYADAAAKFDSGYQRGRINAFLFNAAVAWERTGNLQEAVERYAEYLVREPNASDRPAIESRLLALREALANQSTATVGQLATKGLAIITSNPDGAEIRLDDPRGKIFARTPFRGTLPIGEHVIHVFAKGYKPESKTLPDGADKLLIAHFSLSEEYFLGHLEVASDIDGADVFLKRLTDEHGKPIPAAQQRESLAGQTPFSGQLPPGKYLTRVSKRGYRDHREDIELPQGKIRMITLALPAVDHAFVELRSRSRDSAGAEVYLGGAKTPACSLPCSTTLPAGHHRVIVKQKRKKLLVFELVLKPGDLVEVDVDMQQTTSRVPAIVTGTLLAGALATGIAFAVKARQTRDDLQHDVDTLALVDQDDPRIVQGRRQAIIADALFGVSVVLGALTLYYLLREAGPPSTGAKNQRSLLSRASWIAPAVTPTGVGLAAAWRFR